VTAVRFGLPSSTTYTFAFLFWAMGSGFVAMVAEWRLFAITVSYFVGFFTVVLHPELRSYVSSICHMITTVLVVLLWAPPDFVTPLLDRIAPNRNQPMALFRIGRGRD
jgi:hypothetical protein